jgi:hypothetical protein
LRLRLIDADGRPASPDQPPLVVSFDLPSLAEYPNRSAQIDLDFPNATFHRFGPHAIEIVADGQLVRRLHLRLQPRDDK